MGIDSRIFPVGTKPSETGPKAQGEGKGGHRPDMFAGRLVPDSGQNRWTGSAGPTTSTSSSRHGAQKTANAASSSPSALLGRRGRVQRLPQEDRPHHPADYRAEILDEQRAEDVDATGCRSASGSFRLSPWQTTIQTRNVEPSGALAGLHFGEVSPSIASNALIVVAV